MLQTYWHTISQAIPYRPGRIRDCPHSDSKRNRTSSDVFFDNRGMAVHLSPDTVVCTFLWERTNPLHRRIFNMLIMRMQLYVVETGYADYIANYLLRFTT